MNMMEKIVSSAADGSLFQKARTVLLEKVVHNSNTRHRLLEDIALEELRRDYTPVLDRLLESYQDMPMTYSNKVWVFWRQGYDQAPELIKACFDSVKRHLTDRDIVFLSAENLGQYVTIPDYIEKKREQGIIPEALYSDVVRITLLAEYGGLWLDSTVFCTGSELASRFRDWPIFVFKTEDLDRSQEKATIASNWLISCYAGVPFIRAVRDLMYAYWEREKYMKNYFIFHLFVHMVKDRFPEAWKQIPVYNNVSPHILAFEMLDPYDPQRFADMKKMSDFHKLNRHVADELPEGAQVEGTYFDLIAKEKIV